MVPFVGDQFARFLLGRRNADPRQVLLCRRQRALEPRCVAFIGRMKRCGDDDAGVEIDRVLGLVGEVRTTVFQLGDLAFSLAILASGSVLLVHSSFDSFLPLRARSSRIRSSALGVSMPLSLAICLSISR